MPSRNTARLDLSNTYYHVYSRGMNKELVFLDDADKDYFLYVIARHLSHVPTVNSANYVYPNYHSGIELLSFCLMDNHFHLLVYQKDKGTLAAFMKSVLTGYCAYFNRRHNRTGSVFGGRYRAVSVDNDAYLSHISRYIHLNPRYWQRYKYSSFHLIRKNREPEWLSSERVLQHFSSRAAYARFVADYEQNRDVLAEIKHNLANH